MIDQELKKNMGKSFDSHRTLSILLEPGFPKSKQVDLLRQLSLEQWDALILEAECRSLNSLLFLLLVELNKNYNLDFPSKEKLRQHYINTAVRNTLILHDTEQLFTSLGDEKIAVAGLKGIYLLENVYGDIGARLMNDIDILIKKKDLAKCVRVLEKLGYSSTAYFNPDDENTDTKHVPPMQKSGGAMVEVHWTLLEEDEPFTIDADALWERTFPATIANVDAFSLGIEDLILHLCLHLTYQHYLQIGLRALLDIAMVIHKFQSQIDWNKLIAIAKLWGAERVTALTLKLVETQLNVPIPAEVSSSLLPEGIAPSLLEQARSQLLERVRFEDRLTPDLVQMNANKNVISKIRIGLQRVFIPRLALARTYNISPTSPKIVHFYWIRVKYLIRNYGRTLRRLLKREKTTEPALQKAQASYSLHNWMKPNNN